LLKRHGGHPDDSPHVFGWVAVSFIWPLLTFWEISSWHQLQMLTAGITLFYRRFLPY
jgi:hypothetical protein